MIDRRRIAPILLVVAAGLAAVGSFEDTYRTSYPGYGGSGEQVLSTNLWIVTADPPVGLPQELYNAAGFPVIITAVLMVVAAVFLMRRRTSFAAPVAMGAAGALAGMVLLYVLQVRREKAVILSWPVAEEEKPELSVLGGTYLLVAAALVGLVGAALAQRGQQPEETEEEVDEEAVVVHQLDDDDDTPPFGIAIIGEEQQETR